MAAPTYYIETSVWGSLARRQPRDRKRVVQRMLKLLDGVRGLCVVSETVLDEVSAAPPTNVDEIQEWFDAVQPIVVAVPGMAELLARSYIANKVLPVAQFADAVHVAVPTVFDLDFLVSWNHRHITGRARRRQYHAVNLRNNYEKTPRILNPMEAHEELKKKKA